MTIETEPSLVMCGVTESDVAALSNRTFEPAFAVWVRNGIFDPAVILAD